MTSEETVRLTVGQAVVRFLAQQRSERDGVEHPLFAGCFGIFGHGNVAGIGQALLETADDPGGLRYYQARNEQGMVHASVAFARMRNRLTTMACTASVGPGSTNMVTGAALATVNRLPVLLLPSDVFATRVASPVLQELEEVSGGDVSVNDAFRPVSRFFDRVWHVPRAQPDPAAVARAVELVRAARRPMVVAGGGVGYSEGTDALRRLAEATGIPVAETQAGKGSLPYDHPLSLGAVGSTGTTAANAVARVADLVIGVGTRYSDFTTASRTAFQDPDVRFVNVNVAGSDAAKHAGTMVVCDARAGLEAMADALAGWRAPEPHTQRATALAAAWDETVQRAYTLGHQPLPAQSEIVGVVNEVSRPRDVVVCAAGSLPGDLHKLWRTRDPKGYHVEYGYSCMGYEIAGGLGVRMACPDRDVYVMVGDGSYLMMAQELVTAVQENVKIIVVLVQNHGFASIGALSEGVGSQRFGTSYRYRDPDSGRLDGDVLPVDLAANAAGLGVRVLRADGTDGLRAALLDAQQGSGPVLVHVESDPFVPSPDSESWWDVPVAEVSALASTTEARTDYEKRRSAQRPFL